FAIYGPKDLKITRTRLVMLICVFLSIIVGTGYLLYAENEILNKHISTFSPLSKNNAISQRGMFITYSLDRFYEKPLGNGLGSLSSPKADNKIFAGYTNSHKEVPDKVFYYRVTDAYLAMSLAEKGIIGFVLFVLSAFEIFLPKKRRIAFFFILGLFINLIGTDIPKQGFFYFVIIVIYYGISLKEAKTITTQPPKLV
ncbi:MAG: hypothetical protein AAFQ20_14225, partial [Bacteroidota bacterium]